MQILLTLLALAVVCLAVFDAISTLQAFKRGAREANPLMAWVQDKLPTLWPYVRAAIGVAVAGVGYFVGGLGGVSLLIGATALWGWVVWHNYSIAWAK